MNVHICTFEKKFSLFFSFGIYKKKANIRGADQRSLNVHIDRCKEKKIIENRNLFSTKNDC